MMFRWPQTHSSDAVKRKNSLKYCTAVNKRAQLTHHHPEVMLAQHHPTVDTLRFTKLSPNSEQTNSSVGETESKMKTKKTMVV